MESTVARGPSISGGTGFRNIHCPGAPLFPAASAPGSPGYAIPPNRILRSAHGTARKLSRIIGFPEPEATQRVDPLEIIYHSAQVYRLDARITPRRAASVHTYPGLDRQFLGSNPGLYYHGYSRNLRIADAVPWNFRGVAAPMSGVGYMRGLL